ELLIYDSALSPIERKQVEDYLNAKWFGKKSSSQNPLAWYSGGLDGMTGLAFSKDTGELLISRTEAGRDSVWRLDTASGSGASATQVIQGQSVRDAQWAGPD